MSTVSSVELQEVARQLGRERFDDYASRGLARAYEEYVGRRRRTAAPLSLEVNGRPYASLFAVLTEPEATFTQGELRRDPAGAPSVDAEFVPPFERIRFQEDGSAELTPPGGGEPRRAIARVLLREHFVVRSRAEDVPVPPASARSRVPNLVGTLEQGIAYCRQAAIVPFEVAFLLYFAEERARYEVDAVHGTLLVDPRAGRLAASRRIHRPSRVAWGLDRKIGRGHLSLLAARCLEVLVDSNGLTAIDLTHVFGGVRELVDSALQALVQQRYAVFDPRLGLYRPRLEAFLPAPQATGRPPSAPVRPELRTSVQELIAAADARATCPLCGKPLPAESHALLCDDCAATVGLP